MKNILLMLLFFTLFSCKKSVNLSETRWTLYYKNNPTFNFYAKSEIYLKSNNTIENYRNFDTIYGTWTHIKENVTFQFINDAKFEGNLIASDSMKGTLLLPSGDRGDWSAKRK